MFLCSLVLIGQTTYIKDLMYFIFLCYYFGLISSHAYALIYRFSKPPNNETMNKACVMENKKELGITDSFPLKAGRLATVAKC